MKLKVFTGLVLTLFLIGMLTLAFNIQRVEAAEPPPTEWTKTYGATGVDLAWSMIQTSDGGYALAGCTESFGAGDNDFWLVKVGFPTKVFHVVVDSIDYTVAIRSNSTIPDFVFNQSLKQISFDVTGESGTTGYCNATIPKSLLKGNPWTIKVDNTIITDFDEKTNDTHTFLYFTYTHESPLQVTIEGTWVVPEFPTWTSTLLILIVLSVAIAIHKRRLPKTPIH